MINLLPYQQKKIVERTRVLRFASATLGAIIILVIVAGLLFLPTLMTINSRHGLAERQIALLEQEGVVISEVDIANLDARAQTLVSKFATAVGTSPVTYIATLRGLAQSGVTISGFVLDQSNPLIMDISGMATNRTVLQQFVATLEKDSKIAAVESPITNYVKSKDNEYVIKVTFKE